MQEIESEESQHDTDAWSTRQSTMEERVIDRYVIDTHPTPMIDPSGHDIPVEQLPTTDEEEEEIEEPVVVAASAPVPRHQEQQEKHQQESEVEEEPEVLISSSWNAPNEANRNDDEILEREFKAALEADDVDDGNTFSAELLSRSLEQQKNGVFHSDSSYIHSMSFLFFESFRRYQSTDVDF